MQEAVLLETPHAILYACVQSRSSLRSELPVHEITPQGNLTYDGSVIDTRLRLWRVESFFSRRKLINPVEIPKSEEVNCSAKLTCSKKCS